MRYLGILALLMLLAYGFAWFPNEIKRPRGVLVVDEPEQNLISQPRPWPYKNYTITPLADFHLHARVLMTERYWLGREARLSPVDLTVGWRLMSDQDVLDQLEIYRGYREFYWRPKTSHWPAERADITAHVANMHMIPANEEVDSGLKSIRPGNLIDLARVPGAGTGGGWLELAQFAQPHRRRRGRLRTGLGRAVDCQLT